LEYKPNKGFSIFIKRNKQMALTFPISASIGQTYQSGSSNTYEWTGTYWKIKNVINFNAFSASVVSRINAVTNEQDLSYLATTGSNTFKGQQVVSGSILISGSIIPNTGNGTFTSSFSLGSVTNAWKDLYISQGSIIFVDAITQATSSFTITTDIVGEENTVQYSAAITASKYFGDGGGLYNLPSNTNWNKNKEYILRNTEQLTFSGDYILEDCALLIEGSDEEVEYSANKSFKREGTIFIGGNLLLKDSSIYNDGKISVGGEVILIGNSQIVGNGIII
jgi:hypothetical protein